MSRSLSGTARGFTLVELMIAMVVVAILLALAIPSYSDHVRRANRAEAKEMLTVVAARQTEFKFRFGRYTQDMESALSGQTYDTAGLGLDASTRSGEGDTAYYDVSLSVADGGQAYTATATPAGEFQSEDRCGALEINHTGVRHAAADGCW